MRKLVLIVLFPLYLLSEEGVVDSVVEAVKDVGDSEVLKEAKEKVEEVFDSNTTNQSFGDAIGSIFNQFQMGLSGGAVTTVEPHRDHRVGKMKSEIVEEKPSKTSWRADFQIGFVEDDNDRHSLYYSIQDDKNYDNPIHSVGYTYQLVTNIFSEYHTLPFLSLGIEFGQQNISDSDLEKYNINNDELKFWGAVVGTGFLFPIDIDGCCISNLDISVGYSFRYRGWDQIKYNSIESSKTKDSSTGHSAQIGIVYRY
jgi:hypothetical protein